MKEFLSMATTIDVISETIDQNVSFSIFPLKANYERAKPATRLRISCNEVSEQSSLVRKFKKFLQPLLLLGKCCY
jgi:hypothetical protein